MDILLQKLKVVNEDHTCPVCSELCVDPVTFKNCFHSTCRAHVPESDVFFCPLCGASNRAAKNVGDPSFEKAVAALKGLNDIFLNSVVSSSRKNNDFEEPIPTSSEKGSMRGGIIISKEDNNSPCCEPTARNDSKIFQSGVMDADSSSIRVERSKKNTNDHMSKKNLEKRNRKGETPLHVACVCRKQDKVVELLKSGANPNTKDNAGWTPLHEAVENGAIEIIKILLEHGALSDIPGCHNETPLHEAVRFKRADIAVLLMEHGAMVNTRNIKGETPLDLAKDDNVLRDLLENFEPKTQTANILQVSALCIQDELEDMHVLPISISGEERKQLETLRKKHKNLNVELKFNKKVTHLITEVADDRTCYSNIEILQAIVHGKWILSSDWIGDTVQSGTLSNFEDFEVGGIVTPSSDGPRRARFNKYRQLPGLFDGCHFYLYGFKGKCEISNGLTFTKQFVSKLITDAGGKELRREPNPESIPESETTIPYHASKSGSLAKCSHYIIYYENAYIPTYNMEHLKVFPVDWLFECIRKYDLCDDYSIENKLDS